MKAIYDAIILAGTNSTVIFANENGPRPFFPYTVVNLISTSREINDWDTYDTVNEVLITEGYREQTYSVNFYGDNALDEASIVQSNLTRQDVRELLRKDANSAIISVEAITNMTELNIVDFEQRAMFEFTISIALDPATNSQNLEYFDQQPSVTWTNKPI